MRTDMIAEIYSKPNCPYCDKAKFLLMKNDIDYNEISAVDNRDALIKRVTDVTGSAPKSVPQIFIDGEYVGGYDQLAVKLK